MWDYLFNMDKREWTDKDLSWNCEKTGPCYENFIYKGP